jgi:hypothetical protein
MKYIFIVFFVNFFYAQQINMDNFQIIEKNEVKLKSLSFLGSLEYNKSNCYKDTVNSFYLIYPQNGIFCLKVFNELDFNQYIEENNFPILKENQSVFFEYKNFVEYIRINNFKEGDFIYDNFIKDFEDINLNEEYLSKFENEFTHNKKNINDNNIFFIKAFFCFNVFFKNELDIDWEFDEKYYLHPYAVPYIYDNVNKVSLYELNTKLYDKFFLNKKITFKEILIDVYCSYFEKKFFSTTQNNYFEKKEYKNLLRKEFDKYFVFPFVDIWELQKK